MPADKLGGESVARIDLSTVLIDFLTVDPGGAGAGFEVEADSGEVSEMGGTPGAFGGFADVGGGFEVLFCLEG